MRCPSLVALLILSTLTACTPEDRDGASRQPGRVLIIGLDGLRAEAIAAAKTPNLDSLMERGFSDLNALTGDVSLSGPGWASMLTGVWCDKHRVVDNDLSFEASAFDEFPSLFSRVEALRPELQRFAISKWPPIVDNIFCAVEAQDNCGRATGVSVARDDAGVRDEAVKLLVNEDPHLLFLQFDNIDAAGHGTPPASPPGGFCPFEGGDVADSEQFGVCLPANFNPQYLEFIEIADGLVGDVLQALYRRPNFLAENWIVLVAPDHGGAGTIFNQHGFPAEQDRRTFFIVSGDRVAPLPEGVRTKTVDIAATALFHLRIPIDPAWQLDGQPVGLPGVPPYEDRPIPSCALALPVLGDIGKALGPGCGPLCKFGRHGLLRPATSTTPDDRAEEFHAP